VRAKVVINATGAWADDLRTSLGARRRLRTIRGSHLIFPAEKLPLPEAISLLHPRDGRAVFAIPWEGVTLLGTTDVDHGADMGAEPATSAREADYLMEAASRAFPHMRLSLDDVRSSYSGVRGVIDTGASDPSKESREHAIWREDGLLTVTGGKLTTFRLMAHEALRAVGDVLPAFEGRIARGRILDAGGDGALDGLSSEARGRLVGRHGADAGPLLAAGKELGAEKIDDTPALWAELLWAAKTEGAVHLDDLLLRRVRVGLLGKDGGKAEMPRIRAIAQPELGWDDARWVREEARYLDMWSGCYGTRFA
jgi:glycerol-3-phosphate dehydrogenase